MKMQIAPYNNPKRHLAVFAGLATATALALTGCSSSGQPASGGSSAGSSTARVAFLGTKSASFQNAIYKGLTSVNGIQADFIEVGFDVNKQSQAVDDAVASGKYQGIIMEPNSPTGLIPATTRAIAKGIQVINVEASLGADIKSNAVQIPGQAASIVEPFDKLGSLQTKLALKACKDNGVAVCNIARIGGLPQFGTEQIFTDSTTSETANAGASAKLVGNIYAGGYAAGDGLKAAQDLLSSHPEVNVIMSADPLLKGIAQAVTSSGKKVQIIGIGGSSYGMAQVKAGKWYGDVAFFPEYAGKLSGETMLKHLADPSLKGEELSPSQPGVGPDFTKETADSFAGQYDG